MKISSPTARFILNSVLKQGTNKKVQIKGISNIEQGITNIEFFDANLCKQKTKSS